MTSTFARHTAGFSVIAALLASAAWSADTTVRAPSSSAQRSSSTRSTSGKGPLPDPTLLDGSSQPAEKKSEQGMIGDFELPGDDNVKDGKVGGQSGTPGGKGGQQQQPGLQVSMPGLPGLPMPSGGKEQSSGSQSAGGGGLPDPTKQGGGAGQQGTASMSIPTGAESAGQQQGGGQQQSGGQPQSGGGGADGKPDGQQVGQLQGEGGAAGQDVAGGNGPTGKPAPMPVGDSAMRIEPSVNPATLPGGQQGQIAGQTQQHEKGTGSGGKGSGGAQGGNRVERGKAMPAGL